MLRVRPVSAHSDEVLVWALCVFEVRSTTDGV